MPIAHDQNARTFTVHTDRTTYQMQVDEIGVLEHLYYGRRSAGSIRTSWTGNSWRRSCP